MTPTPDISSRLLDALARLNQVGAAINRIGADTRVDLGDTLRLIAEGAIEVVGSDPTVEQTGDSRASSVIYIYDAATRIFDLGSRLAAGEAGAPIPGDEPRADGMGARAVLQRRRVISYEEPDLDVHEIKIEAGAKVVVCYPLIVAEQPLGALYVYLQDHRRFSALELLMLDNFVNQAAIAIHQAQQIARVQRDLDRKQEELDRLHRADLLISSRLRLEETLEAILQMALEVTGAKYGIFRLVDRAGGHLLTRAIAGDDLGRPAVEALPINATSITGWVAKYRKPLVIADVREGRWARLYYPLDHELDMRAELAVPLLGANSRLEGVLNLESPRVGAFSEDDSRLLQSLATQAVIAIQEVRLLDALQEISERLLTQPARQVLDRVVELACDLLNVPVSTVWTLDGDDLALRAAAGFSAEVERVPLDGSFLGLVLLKRNALFSPDVRDDARFLQRELARRQGWTQALVVPLLASDEGDPVGVLAVFDTENSPGQFAASDWDKKVLTFLAHHAALAVHNAAHQDALRLAREQQAAAETFAAVGDIAANLLHRLNNKIGTIPVRVEGIEYKSEATLALDAYLARNLAEIGRSAVEAMEIVRDSLVYLRPIHLAPVDVAVCVSEALAATEVPEAVTISTFGLETLPPVLAGRRRLGLVFINLLENAITAMEGAGEISISGRVQQKWLEITVSDSGPGILPDLHERIFEFNYSGAKHSSAKLGFGLWWVKTIMARFGGTIAVESDGQKGTTFVLKLPVNPLGTDKRG